MTAAAWLRRNRWIIFAWILMFLATFLAAAYVAATRADAHPCPPPLAWGDCPIGTPIPTTTIPQPTTTVPPTTTTKPCVEGPTQAPCGYVPPPTTPTTVLVCQPPPAPPVQGCPYGGPTTTIAPTPTTSPPPSSTTVPSAPPPTNPPSSGGGSAHPTTIAQHIELPVTGLDTWFLVALAVFGGIILGLFLLWASHWHRSDEEGL